MADTDASVRMADVGAQLARQWKTVAAVVVILAVAGAVLGFALPRHYTARAVLTVSPIPTSPLTDSSAKQDAVNMTTERAVIQSTEVAGRARRILHSSASPADLVARLDVGSPPESQVLEADATAGTPQEAARVANAFASGYLDTRAARARSTVAKSETNLDKRTAALTRKLASESDGAAADSLRGELRDLESQRSAVATTVVDAGHVVTEADAATATSSLGPAVYAVGGLVVGVLLGIAVGLLRERFARTVTSGARLAGLTGLPVVEQAQPDFLDRIAMRASVGTADPPATIAVLGMGAADSAGLGGALRERLVRTGFRLATVADGAGGTPGSLGEDSRTGNGTGLMVKSINIADGLARSVLLGRGADRVVLAVSRDAALADVNRFLSELAPAEVDVVAVMVPLATRRRRTPAGGSRFAPVTGPPHAGASTLDGPTGRFAPVGAPADHRRVAEVGDGQAATRGEPGASGQAGGSPAQ